MGVDDLAHNQKTLVLLDFIFAKAKYAKDIDASKPIFREDGIINIKQGCHPLLDRKKSFRSTYLSAKISPC